ncbi:hypothetical protein [Weissella cibaria]|uniref:hypothetical protein n=1 Tax=Weissella cibaria TaxID=137591 RepID=UPI001C1F6616|nr:hypothetical protein [Weissella cibaria]MBU7544729.1 hypothetical protein [Weissella cibaria]MCV3317706.1 hypothetical protein [Weissella cibaria]
MIQYLDLMLLTVMVTFLLIMIIINSRRRMVRVKNLLIKKLKRLVARVKTGIQAAINYQD